MGGYCAHFLFDTFREFPHEGVFLRQFLTLCILFQTVLLNKSVISGKGCRSPPSILASHKKLKWRIEK
jgi:hypothetical protein